MDNLSFHITDIAANSIRAGATDITLKIMEQSKQITICIADNGCGMDAETVARVTNPFYTTRTTRKIGLGLPFLIQNAEQTKGSVSIHSVPGQGTEVLATFISSHIDCPPWGDLAGTVAMLITGNPNLNIHFVYQKNGQSFNLCTKDLNEVLDGVPLNLPQVTLWIKDMIEENINSLQSN